MNKIVDINSLKLKLINGGISLGSWIQISNTTVATIMSHSGTDWLALDLEHGIFDNNSILQITHLLKKSGNLPFARIRKNDLGTLKTCITAGVNGIIHAQVEEVDEIENLISFSKYPPFGVRGLGFEPGNNYGLDLNEGFNSKIFHVAMIESKKGMMNLENLITKSDIDAFLIGPYDLSLSLGIPGQFKNPIYVNAEEEIKNILKEYRKPFGVHIVELSKSELKKRVKEGCQFIPFSMDTVLIDQLRKVINNI